MLDPVSAVGVAAATVQFVDFITKLMAVGHDLSTKGGTEDLVQLDEVYSHLQKTSATLAQATGSAVGGSGATSQDGPDFSRLATACRKECDGFLAAVEKLRTKSGGVKGFRTFRQALKIIWNEKTVQALETRLERYQRELTLALVAHLR
jgi:hypothetical protein